MGDVTKQLKLIDEAMVLAQARSGQEQSMGRKWLYLAIACSAPILFAELLLDVRIAG